MNVLFVVLPVAILMATGMLIAFVRSALGGQFDDLESPPHRAIFDESAVRERR